MTERIGRQRKERKDMRKKAKCKKVSKLGRGIKMKHIKDVS